jgi:hypothetical protein
MAANIHPVSVISNGTRDSADFMARLKNNRTNIRTSRKFKRRGQARWSCADNHSSFRRLCRHAAPRREEDAAKRQVIKVNNRGLIDISRRWKKRSKAYSSMLGPDAALSK